MDTEYLDQFQNITVFIFPYPSCPVSLLLLNVRWNHKKRYCS